MAKNLFEQLLTKAGEIWSGPKTQDNHHMYIEDSNGLSGVAKYLAKQEQAAKQKEEAIAAHATGVEKYLARQQVATPQAGQKAPSSSVEKYLARQASGASIAPKEPVVIPKTGVGKYLAGIPLSTGAKAAPAPERKSSQQNKLSASKASATAKKPAGSSTVNLAATAASTAPQVVETPVSSASTGDEMHSESVARCQASTVKGTQCKNTTHLTKIQRTINKKKYHFLTCKQHHNDSFKPYAPFLDA